MEDSSALSASPSPSVSDLNRSCPLGLLLISTDPVEKQMTIFYAQKKCLVPLEAGRGVGGAGWGPQLRHSAQEWTKTLSQPGSSSCPTLC